MIISGIPTAGPASSLLVQETSTNQFTIHDGTKFVGTFSAGSNLILNLAHYNTSIDIDVDGHAFGGNVHMNLGLGNINLTQTNPVSIYDSVGGGSIGGNITVLNGSGGELIGIGQVGLTPQATPPALRIGGDVTVVARKGGSQPGSPNAGDSLFVGPGSTIGGNLATSFVDGVNIGEPTFTQLSSVDGNVTLNDATSPHFIDVEDVGFVGKNLTVTGSSFGDSFSLAQATAGVGGLVSGNVTLNLGTANGLGESVFTDSTTAIAGNFSISSQGSSGNLDSTSTEGLYFVGGQVGGNLTLAMGQGDNAVGFTATVFGSMSVSAGHGMNDLGGGSTGFGSFTGTVAGNLSFNFGNGSTNFVTITNAPAGKLYWISGNGTDSLDLEGTAGSVYNLSIVFGSSASTNTLTFDSSNTGITFQGSVVGSGSTNTFTQGSNDTITQFAFINFP